MPWDDLFAEAQWQLSVCNACRYCEGYCPVWPALAQQPHITPSGFVHLSNLCHDCRDCFTACMYAAPHEFDLNPPRLFAQGREHTYRHYFWPRSLPGWIRGWRAVVTGVAVAAALLALVSAAVTPAGAGHAPGSPYALIPHTLLIGLFGAAALWSIGALLTAGIRYWRDTHGQLRELRHLGHWLRALLDGAQLRHMTGGGSGCAYPDEDPNNFRRGWHHVVSYGFALCVLSTTSAAISQQVFGIDPPYPILSVPVLTGSIGGLGIATGSVALLALKRRNPRQLSTDHMRVADLGLLWSLLLLAVTGLLTLALRTGPLFTPILALHLAAVLVAFLIAPYTKFTHWIFRLLALYKASIDGITAPGGRV